MCIDPSHAHGYHFGIDRETDIRIFYTTHQMVSYAAVTPEVVAERIANIL